MSPALFLTFAIPFILATRTNAESHTIKFANNCGFGSPALMYNGENVVTGDTYSIDGPFSGIAYLQTGNCNLNGENCTLLEMTLINPTCAGCGSSTDISLIPPHAYNVATSFEYYDGCDGLGQTCSDPNCPTAFFNPNDNFVQVACQTENVNLLITFCPVSSSSSSPGGTTSTNPVATLPTATTSPSPTSTPSSSPTFSLSATTSPTNALTSSGSAGTTTPSSASSPSPSSVPTSSTPTTSTPATSPTTTSTPGALGVSPTASGPGSPYPTNTAGGRCRPRTSSIPPIPTPTTVATTVTSVPPKQCGAPSPATSIPMRHRRSRHARSIS